MKKDYEEQCCIRFPNTEKLEVFRNRMDHSFDSWFGIALQFINTDIILGRVVTSTEQDEALARPSRPGLKTNSQIASGIVSWKLNPHNVSEFGSNSNKFGLRTPSRHLLHFSHFFPDCQKRGCQILQEKVNPSLRFPAVSGVEMKILKSSLQALLSPAPAPVLSRLT